MIGGFNLPAYDYIVLTTSSTTDIYTFGIGTSGTVIAKVTLTYTGTDRTLMSTVIKQ